MLISDYKWVLLYCIISTEQSGSISSIHISIITINSITVVSVLLVLLLALVY